MTHFNIVVYLIVNYIYLYVTDNKFRYFGINHIVVIVWHCHRPIELQLSYLFMLNYNMKVYITYIHDSYTYIHIPIFLFIRLLYHIL